MSATTSRSVRWSLVLCFVVVTAWARPVAAQCTNVWLPGDPIPGADDMVRASCLWDPDGPGPAPSKLVVGGNFSAVLNAAAERIAVIDLQTGVATPLGSGITGSLSGLREVRAVAGLPNGDLIVGGIFSSAGGVAATSLARWNGSAWSTLGSGVTAGGGLVRVEALAVLPNGDLIVGGGFTQAGGITANQIARWDGTSWSALGSGALGLVTSLAVMPNGDLVAGGAFTTMGGVAASMIARWDGTSWSALGSGITGSVLPPSPPPPPREVEAIAVAPNGDIFASGFFDSAGGIAVNNIARWDGSAWSPVGAGLNNYSLSLCALANGDVIAGGYFTSPAACVARWNGTAWSSVGVGLGNEVHTLLELPNGNLLAGGRLSTAPSAANFLARFDGTSWKSLVVGGLIGRVTALAAVPNGDVIAGGYFDAGGGFALNRVARRSNGAWLPIGAGISGPVAALAVAPNGNIFAGGFFFLPGGTHIARWNGAVWLPVGTGTNADVYAVTVLPNGDVIAGGQFTTAGGIPANHIARWNGASWSPLGAGTNFEVNALAVMANGDVVAAGAFTTAGGVAANRVARWNGTSWSSMGSGTDGQVRALAVLPNGDLIAGGQFFQVGAQSAYLLARWNGTTWTGEPGWTGDGPIRALVPLANNDFVAAGGDFSGLVARKRSGGSWQTLGQGAITPVETMALVANGDVAVGGAFTRMNGAAAAFYAQLSTTCPATTSVQGLGCPSSGGTNTLAATTLPWVNSTFRARGTGLPVSALVVTLTSVTPVPQGVAPLTLGFAQAGTGCDVLVAPDILGSTTAVGGIADSSLFLASTPSLVGVAFYHQMIPFEFDSFGALVAVTATNALQVMAGVF